MNKETDEEMDEEMDEETETRPKQDTTSSKP